LLHVVDRAVRESRQAAVREMLFSVGDDVLAGIAHLAVLDLALVPDAAAIL
jgi:hypothetical protein